MILWSRPSPEPYVYEELRLERDGAWSLQRADRVLASGHTDPAAAFAALPGARSAPRTTRTGMPGEATFTLSVQDTAWSAPAIVWTGWVSDPIPEPIAALVGALEAPGRDAKAR